MIIPDANLFLYAYDADSTQHLKAREWVEEVFSGEEPVRLPWQTVGAFLRIVTNPALRGERFTPQEAVAIVDEWLAQPNVRMLGPGEGHWPLLCQTIMEGQVRGPLMTEAQLAALTIEHGATLYTTDRDFSRFPGLRWKNPLASRSAPGA
ncbi:MAG: TA system VapC family ribonuclease toxin [Bryobacteraceae bacterium]|jgi:toxin-antitoxin system PIN domain toxin